MTGPAVQSGDAFGGFIEGLGGGFERGTDFRRQRRFEQQVAEQLRMQTMRQSQQDKRQGTLDSRAEVRQVVLDDRATEDRLRAQQLEDFNLLETHGLLRTEQDAPGPASKFDIPESVSRLRGVVGDKLQNPQPAAGPAMMGNVNLSAVGQQLTGQGQQSAEDALLESIGFRRIDRPAQRSFEVDVDGVKTTAGSEAEALRLQGVFREPEASTARFSVDSEGRIAFTGGTQEEAEAFAGSRSFLAQEGSSGRAQALSLLAEVGASGGELSFAETLDDDELEKFASDRLKSSKINPTESERRAAAVFPRAERGHAEILGLVRDEFGGAPGLATLFGKGFLARGAQSEAIQRFQVAGRAVVSAFLRFESGAAISEKEFEDAIETFIPQFNDDEGTVKLKLEILDLQIGALGQAAELVLGERNDEHEPGNPYAPGR